MSKNKYGNERPDALDMILSKAREIRAADPRLDGKGHKSITLNGVKLNSMQGVCSCEFCVAMDRKELEQQNA